MSLTHRVETKVICKQPGRYIGWPTVARSDEGVLYAVFSGDRDGHICPFGKSYFTRSDDHGETWSEPVVVNDTPLDDRDTGLCVCPDGTLVMNWFTSHYYGRYSIMHAEGKITGKKDFDHWSAWEKQVQSIARKDAEHWAPIVAEPSDAEREKWTNAAREYGCDPIVPDSDDDAFPIGTRRMGYWTRRSHDGGRTWDEPTPAPVSTPHGPNVLPNGDLIYIGTGPFKTDDGRKQLGVARSTDQGKTWQMLARISASPRLPGEEDATFAEPHVVATASDKLLGMTRYTAKPLQRRYLWQFESVDGGKTWTKPIMTDVLGFPPHLLKLRDERILLSYGIRHDPPGQRFRFSTDEGETWDAPGALDLTDAPSGDLGYPSTVELDDGSFVSVYYQREKLEEKPCLMMTRWSQ